MRMGMVLRHALAVLVLPGTVAVLVPWWIARSRGVTLGLPGSAPAVAVAAAGFVVLTLGVVLFLGCFRRFDQEGRGTLAPWDPPGRLVVRGPYAYVRNPMISGVMLVLVGEALLLRSPAHLVWAGAFFLINAIYIPAVEEPGLRRRFGEAYERYAREVPRLVPRLRPFRAGPPSS
jgi:protein-S-isoprenylcysteine O-methyltransferase Ste14